MLLLDPLLQVLKYQHDGKGDVGVAIVGVGVGLGEEVPSRADADDAGDHVQYVLPCLCLFCRTRECMLKVMLEMLAGDAGDMLAGDASVLVHCLDMLPEL